MISGDGPARRGSNLYTTVLAANRGVCSLQRGVREHPVKDASHAALIGAKLLECSVDPIGYHHIVHVYNYLIISPRLRRAQKKSLLPGARPDLSFTPDAVVSHRRATRPLGQGNARAGNAVARNGYW
jgi:hypothetical protein